MFTLCWEAGEFDESTVFTFLRHFSLRNFVTSSWWKWMWCFWPIYTNPIRIPKVELEKYLVKLKVRFEIRKLRVVNIPSHVLINHWCVIILFCVDFGIYFNPTFLWVHLSGTLNKFSWQLHVPYRCNMIQSNKIIKRSVKGKYLEIEIATSWMHQLNWDKTPTDTACRHSWWYFCQESPRRLYPLPSSPLCGTDTARLPSFCDWMDCHLPGTLTERGVANFVTQLQGKNAELSGWKSGADPGSV